MNQRHHVTSSPHIASARARGPSRRQRTVSAWSAHLVSTVGWKWVPLPWVWLPSASSKAIMCSAGGDNTLDSHSCMPSRRLFSSPTTLGFDAVQRPAKISENGTFHQVLKVTRSAAVLCITGFRFPTSICRSRMSCTCVRRGLRFRSQLPACSPPSHPPPPPRCHARTSCEAPRRSGGAAASGPSSARSQLPSAPPTLPVAIVSLSECVRNMLGKNRRLLHHIADPTLVVISLPAHAALAQQTSCMHASLLCPGKHACAYAADAAVEMRSGALVSPPQQRGRLPPSHFRTAEARLCPAHQSQITRPMCPTGRPSA